MLSRPNLQGRGPIPSHRESMSAGDDVMLSGQELGDQEPWQFGPESMAPTDMMALRA
jgi:hypothetical protein